MTVFYGHQVRLTTVLNHLELNRDRKVLYDVTFYLTAPVSNDVVPYAEVVPILNVKGRDQHVSGVQSVCEMAPAENDAQVVGDTTLVLYDAAQVCDTDPAVDRLPGADVTRILDRDPAQASDTVPAVNMPQLESETLESMGLVDVNVGQIVDLTVHMDQVVLDVNGTFLPAPLSLGAGSLMMDGFDDGDGDDDLPDDVAGDGYNAPHCAGDACLGEEAERRVSSVFQFLISKIPGREDDNNLVFLQA